MIVSLWKGLWSSSCHCSGNISCILTPITWRVNPFLFFPKWNPVRKQIKEETLWLNIKWTSVLGFSLISSLPLTLSSRSFMPVETLWESPAFKIKYLLCALAFTVSAYLPSSTHRFTFPRVSEGVSSEKQSQKDMCTNEEVYYKGWLMWF